MRWLHFANDDVSWHLERRDADVFDELPYTLRTDYSLSGIAKSHELRKAAIAAIESCVRERRSRGDLQLRHAHAITQPAYNLRWVMRQSYVGQTHTQTHIHTYPRTYIFTIPERTNDTSNLVRGMPSRLESNIEFLKKIRRPIFKKNFLIILFKIKIGIMGPACSNSIKNWWFLENFFEEY